MVCVPEINPLNSMEEKTRIESAVQHLKEYFETRWDLFVLNSSERASDIVSSIAAVLLIAVSLLFVLLFLSIGAAIWIGHSYGDSSIGFLIVALFYLMIGIVLYIFRRSLIKIPVINKFLNALYRDEEN